MRVVIGESSASMSCADINALTALSGVIKAVEDFWLSTVKLESS